MNHTPAMRHLLWKDFHQVRPALVGCAAMLACIQLLYLAAQLLERGTSMAIFQGAYTVALVAPTLAAIACSGLLIGQERQTGTWNWSSSLPVSWSSALASKAIVWLLGSIGLTLVLLLFYAILYWVALRSGRAPGADATWNSQELPFFLAMLLLIPIEVFVVFSIAALLWNDTLLALVTAGIAVCIGNLLLVDPAVRAIHGVPMNRPFNPPEHLVTVSLLLGSAIALAAVGLAFAFRWRWTSGQLASVALLSRLRSRSWTRQGGASLAYASGQTSVTRPRAARGYWSKRMGKPNEMAMMFAHACRSSFGPRAGIFVAILLLLAILPSQWHFYPPLMVLGSLLMGTTVFGSEHPLNRYRFFSDRGASWMRFLVTHLLVAFVWWLAMLVTARWLIHLRDPAVNFGVPAVWIVAVLGFGAALFSSLCVANSIIAFSVAGIALLGCGVCYETADRFWVGLVGRGGPLESMLPLTVAIVAVALLYQTRRWLLLERPRALGLLVGTWIAALVLPVGLSLTFGFLTIPNTPWQGIPTNQLGRSSPARLPPLVTALPPLTPSMDGRIVWRPNAMELILESDPASLLGFSEQSEESLADIRAWLDAWDEPLEQLNAEVAAADSFVVPDSRTVTTYNRLIEESAKLGVVATQAGDIEEAQAAWKLNHALLALGENSADLATHSLLKRIETWALWDLLTADQVADLGDEIDLKELLPGHVPDAVWAQSLKTRWTLRKLSLGSGTPQLPLGGRLDSSADIHTVLKYYPPLRWPIERLMALRLSEELAMLEGQRYLAPGQETQSLAAHDPVAFQIQLLRQLQQQVSGKFDPAR